MNLSKSFDTYSLLIAHPNILDSMSLSSVGNFYYRYTHNAKNVFHSLKACTCISPIQTFKSINNHLIK